MRRNHVSQEWRLAPADLEAEKRLQHALGIHPITARLLAQRGILAPEEGDAFLRPTLDRLHDPLLLPDAEAACARMKNALATRERILVYGDYDSDGVTSAALLTRFLRSLGATVDVFVPHRKRDGYDIRMPAIEQARRDGVRLIVTSDCGIQRVEEVECARAYGIDVIITDHHTPRSDGCLPRAVAVVNPQRKDSRYPFRYLAGVGVAFKLCEALTSSLGYHVQDFYRAFLDLAMIGTIADVMPLVGENRILVKNGLSQLACTRKPGLRALLAVCGKLGKPIDTRTITHAIGPRLNSASRVDETQIALDLLLTREESEARRLAERLQNLNTMRQELQAQILEDALRQVSQQDTENLRCMVVCGTAWPSGIVGLVAGKVAEQYHRPCIAIAIDPATGEGRGSARSIRALNIYEAIDSCRHLLIEYGGHSHAAGLAIAGDAIAEFTEAVNRFAAGRLTEQDLAPCLDVDMEVGPEEFTPELVEQIEALAPFGNGNPEPRFVSRGVRLTNVERMGQDKHLRINLRVPGLNGDDVVEAPWFFQGALHTALESLQSLDLCYCPRFNDFRGRRSIQFIVADVQPPEW